MSIPKVAKVGSKLLITTLLAFLLLTVLKPSEAMARLLVLSPDNVLTVSDAIVVGTITIKKEEGGTAKATISVERVLKGMVKSKYIELRVGPYVPKGNSPDAFPDKGVRVFVALKGNESEGWSLTSDLNAVAIVTNYHVSSIHNGFKIGINDGHWEPGDYVKSCDQFYRSHMTWIERVSEWIRNLFI